MSIDHGQRAFLLGMSDEETEGRIEQDILKGVLDAESLGAAEDELIDDFVLGRLNANEVCNFNAHFLTTEDRRQKLEFCRFLTAYAEQQSFETAEPNGRRLKTFRLPSLWWSLTIASTLACLALIATLLWFRAARLSRELVEARNRANERTRLEAALQQQQAQSQVSRDGTSMRSQEKPSPPSSSSGPAPWSRGILLTPGRRGVERAPVLYLAGHSDFIWFSLELDFDPRLPLREELLRSDDAVIWSQEFSGGHSIAAHRITSFALPVQLITPGDYRIRVSEQSPENSWDVVNTYPFRVSR